MKVLGSKSLSNLRSQKGASALEYIVLATAIIAIVTVLSTNTTVKTTLETAFEDLFQSASSSE